MPGACSKARTGSTCPSLREFSVGYRALGGDNTYPLLTDWRSGATVRTSSSRLYSPPQRNYWAIFTYVLSSLKTHTRSHVTFQRVRVMPWAFGAIASFSFSTALSRFSPQQSKFLLWGSAYHVGCQSLSLPLLRMDKCGSWIGEACIYEVNRIVLNTTNQSLRLSIRDRTGNQYIRAIVQRQDGFICLGHGLPVFSRTRVRQTDDPQALASVLLQSTNFDWSLRASLFTTQLR